MHGQIAAGETAAGCVTVAQLNRQRVVGAGRTIVDHVDGEIDIASIVPAGAGNVGRVAAEGESSDSGGGEKDA